MKYKLSILFLLIMGSLLQGMEEHNVSDEKNGLSLPLNTSVLNQVADDTEKISHVRRSHSSPDLREVYKPSLNKDSRDDKIKTPKKLTKIQVIDFLKNNPDPSVASSVMEFLKKQKGKEKVESSKKSKSKKRKKNKHKSQSEEDQQLAAIKAMQEEEKAERKKRGVGAQKMASILKNIGATDVGNKVAHVMGEAILDNTKTLNQKDLIYAQGKVDALRHEQEKKTQLEIAQNDSRERWSHEPEAREREARERSKAIIKSQKKWISLIKNYGVAIVGGAAACYFAAKHGSKVLFDEIQRVIGIPKLAQDSSLLTLREKILEKMGRYKREILKSENIIFNAAFGEQIKDLTNSIAETAKNHGYFRNILFYGPPGTGKTLLAKTIAYNSGLDYTYFSASDLLRLTEKDALNQITDLIEYAQTSSKPLAMIVDESEILFADRNGKQHQSMANLLNLILSHTGKASKKFFVIGLTNNRRYFDSAMLSRFGRIIEFPLPQEREIRVMLDLYIKQYLLTPVMIEPTWFEKLCGKKARKRQIVIDRDALNKEMCDDIVNKLQGCVGRDVDNLVVSLQSEAFATKGLRLTKKKVQETVNQFILEKRVANYQSEQVHVS